jgi:excisionase family DNA binding protein
MPALRKEAAPHAGVPHYLTVEEAAAMLRIRPRTVCQMVSRRRIPFRKAGRLLLFEAS